MSIEVGKVRYNLISLAYMYISLILLKKEIPVDISFLGLAIFNI